MTRRFVIATDPMSAEDEKALQAALSHLGWWHWIPNFWLITDTLNFVDVFKIRDIIMGINSSYRCIVIEVDHKAWAAMVRPDSLGNDMAKWIRETWANEKQ